VIEVENPLRAEESVLRPAVLPGLLRAVAFNASHGEPDVALFELGTVFAPPQPGAPLPTERLHVAIVRAHQIRRMPHEPDRVVDAYDLTAVLHAVMGELRIADWRLEAAAVPGLHPGRAARVVVDGAAIGAIGEVAPGVLTALDLPAPVVAAELDVDALLAAVRTERRAPVISRFPASSVDLALVVDEVVPSGEVRATLVRAGGSLLEEARLFDVFRSDALGAGKVSLAFSLRFRAPDRTLTDDEVGALRRAAIDATAAAHGAELRA
jgi:phenylalanyl-tRNA synthetase beta chain